MKKQTSASPHTTDGKARLHKYTQLGNMPNRRIAIE